jgi:hypothetical protein
VENVTEALCGDCLDFGNRVEATCALPGGSTVCDMHYRKRLGNPVIKTSGSGGNEIMPEKKSIDWAAVQADRDSGIPVSEICKKYGVANPTVYTRTTGNGSKSNGLKKSPLKFAKRGAAKSVVLSGSNVMIQASAELVDAVWNNLTLQRKAELLSKLGGG